MHSFLCDEPPPPPADIPELEEVDDTGMPIAESAIRQQMEAHRSDPKCAACHQTMDPIGFGLENFDSIGRWRSNYNDGVPVKADGVLGGNDAFSTAGELVQLLEQDNRVYKCVSEKLLSYAIGRNVHRKANTCFLEKAALGEDGQGRSFSEVIKNLVLSPYFSATKGSQ